MTTKTSITHAYCSELNRVVTITQARREYLSLAQDAPRFHFYCSDPHCWTSSNEPQVQVIGANYTFLAEEGEKFKSAHFKRHPTDQHNPQCEWDIDVPQLDVPGEPDEVRLIRKAKQKVTDLVEVFDMRLDAPRVNTRPHVTSTPHDPIGGIQPEAPDAQWTHRGTGQTRSRDLERLVESYREAQSKLGFQRAAELPLQISTIAKTTYGAFFQHIKFGPHAGVMYGGAVFTQDLNRGFVLKFFDDQNNLPLYLVVKDEQMAAQLNSRYLRRIVDQLKATRQYVRVYAIGEIAFDKPNNCYRLEVRDLRHLVLIPSSK